MLKELVYHIEEKCKLNNFVPFLKKSYVQQIVCIHRLEPYGIFVSCFYLKCTNFIYFKM